MAVARKRRPRRRSSQAGLARPSGRPLLRGYDHGDPITVRPTHLGLPKRADRWTTPFVVANREALRRLDLRPEVKHEDQLVVRLHPGRRIGATALVCPGSRKVSAGLLIRPRYPWTAFADVIGSIGFAAELRIRGGQLVPGSAREVPAWLLAGQVLRRLAAVVRDRQRVFVPRTQIRTSARGSIDWARYARHCVGSGRWHHLPCQFSEPQDDPLLLAMMRWTIDRVQDSLAPMVSSPVGRALLDQCAVLLAEIGPGMAERPQPRLLGALTEARFEDAYQAMFWVSEERGLGGAQVLDGLAWDLAVDEVWEHWVAHFVESLAPRLGMTAIPRGQTRRSLRWTGRPASMGSLMPDSGMRRADRAVWVDAKYKSHLMLLARKGWSGVTEAVRQAHRADLHQALAYTSLCGVEQVDTVLAYPVVGESEERAPMSVASVTAGGRRVRLVLAGLPFGFRSPGQRERVVRRWRGVLAGG